MFVGSLAKLASKLEIALYISCFTWSQGGYLLYLYTGGVRMKDKIQTPKKWIHCKFCTQKYCDPAHLLPKNLGDNFILVINLITRNYFLRYYIIKLRENGNCWKFLPPKNGTFMFENFRPKNMAFKWNFRPKTMARTPPYANMASTPWVRDFGLPTSKCH